MSENNLKFVIPEDLLEEMRVHDIFVCPGMGGASVLTMIQDLSADALGHVLRVYLLKEENHELIVDFELEAFKCPSHHAAVLFANRLPHLTALELLMIQNGYDFELRTEDPLILQ